MRKKLIVILLLVAVFLFGRNTLSVIKANETVSPEPQKVAVDTKTVRQNKNIVSNDAYIDDPISKGWTPLKKYEAGKIVTPEGAELRYQFGGFGRIGETIVDDPGGVQPVVPNVYLFDPDVRDPLTPDEPGTAEEISGLFGAAIGAQTSKPFNFIFKNGSSPESLTLGEPENVRLYKKVANGNTSYMMQTDLKTSYEASTNVAIDFLGQITMEPHEETGSVKIDTYVKNNDSLNTFEQVALGSSYDTYLYKKDDVPIRLYGSQKGLQIRMSREEDRDNMPEGKVYLLNYMFKTDTPVENWRGGQYVDQYANSFIEEKYRGFPNIDSQGDELNGNAAGTVVYEGRVDGGDTAIRMKTQPIENFTKGTVIGYNYNIGLKAISFVPSLALDENEGVYNRTKDTEHLITGQWEDSDSSTSYLYASIDGGPKKEVQKLQAYVAGAGGEVKYALPISDLTPNADKKHTIKLTLIDKDDPDKQSESAVSEYTLYEAQDPVISLNKNSDLLTGKDYIVTGTLSDRDEFKPTPIYYKKWDTTEYKQATVVQSGESTFSFVIPASEIPMTTGANHVFDIYAANRFGLKSNVEGLKLSMDQKKPVFTLDSTVKTLIDGASEYELALSSYAHVGLYYPLVLLYQVDDNEWNTLEQEIGTKTDTLDTVSGAGDKFKIPASELSFGTNHTVKIKVKDRFGVESADSQDVQFIMPGKPALTLENQQGPSLGETQVVKGTLKTEYFPVKFQYKIVKNGEAGAVYQEVSEKDVTIDQTTGKFSFSIAEALLPAGASYDIFVKGLDKYNQESEEVSYHLTEVVHFKAKFVNSVGDTIHPDITIDRELGTKIDLALEEEVQATITKLKQQYTLVDSSVPKELIDVNSSTAFWEYKFTGRLTYVSSPEAFDFRLQVASYKKIRIDDPEVIGLPLVVSDTRESKPGWSLNVKLTEELLNEDGKTPLKNAVRYKHGKTETILNSQSLPVFQNLDTGKYDISKDWSPAGDGLKLEIAPGAVNALGKYHGEILFELSETP
ncbi:hypothetical protein ACWOEF_05510 [Enterococcus crotali]